MSLHTPTPRLPLRLPLLLPPPLPIPREGWLLTLQSARGPPNRLLIFFSLKNIVSLPLGRVLWGMSGESGWNSDSCSEPTSSSRTEMLACHFWMLQSRRTAWDCCQLPRSGCPTQQLYCGFLKKAFQWIPLPIIVQGNASNADLKVFPVSQCARVLLLRAAFVFHQECDL
jgi:hypothetical protein